MAEFLKILICYASLHVTVKILGDFFYKPNLCWILSPPAVTSGMKAAMGLFSPTGSSSLSGISSFRSLCSHSSLIFFLNYGFVVYMACLGCERNDVFLLSVNRLKVELLKCVLCFVFQINIFWWLWV